MRSDPSLVQFESDDVIRVARTRSAMLGTEDRPVNATGWDSTQTTGDYDVVAFSLRPVRVRFEDDRSVVLNPGVVALPGPSTSYRRTPAIDAGQRTIFIGLRRGSMSGLLGCDAPPQRFAPADPAAGALACRLERAVFSHHAGSTGVEALLIDETIAEIVRRTGHSISKHELRSTKCPSRPTGARWRAIANEVAVALTRRPGDPPSLDSLADDHELSPAYLARVFKHEFGLTMHACASAARLARTLERLPDARGQLTRLAYECGFASHAHMTGVFRTALGMTPSEVADETAVELSTRIGRSLH